MVVVYHTWIGRVSGGIDIFLLISSYLLMQTFLRRIDRNGPLNVVQYCLKAFRRLLPPAVITILGTLGLAYFFYPPERFRPALSEAFASTAYYENWYLAFTSADYYANKDQVSPFQHFWSLSIQGQIFLAWPVLILLTVWIARKLGVRARSGLWAVYGIIFVASLTWSIYLTNADQTYAYFSTFTRLWEFAMGALFALALPIVEQRFGFGPNFRGTPSLPNRLVRATVGWVAFIAILLCGIIWDVQGGFPGFMALWPTGAALLVIAVGRTHLPWSVDSLLSTRPFQYLGDISYALYLVHWPLLITLTITAEGGKPGWLRKLTVLIGGIIIAGLLTRFVDAPIRYSKWLNQKRRRSAAVIAVALAAALVPLTAANIHLDRMAQAADRLAARNNPGARVLLDPSLREDTWSASPLPLRTELKNDWYGLGSSCTQDYYAGFPQLKKNCQHINPQGKKKVFIIGSSRIEQYSGMFEQYARQNDWSLTALYQGGCAHGAGLKGGEPGVSRQCAKWNEDALAFTLTKKPDLVILTSSFKPKDSDNEEIVQPGVQEAIRRYLQGGSAVLALRDAPRFSTDPNVNIERAQKTAFKATQVYPTPDPSKAYIASLKKQGKPVSYLDPSPWICPAGACPMIIGNIYVYLDQNHITAQYAKSMGPLFAREAPELALPK